MKHSPDGRRRADDIDRIVEALIADPSRSEDLKSLLRRKIRSHGTVAVPHATRGMAEKPRLWQEDEGAAEQAEELWDNLPV